MAVQHAALHFVTLWSHELLSTWPCPHYLACCPRAGTSYMSPTSLSWSLIWKLPTPLKPDGPKAIERRQDVCVENHPMYPFTAWSETFGALSSSWSFWVLVTSCPPQWTYVTTPVTTVYNGSGFTVAQVYLAWLIPPLVGERAGAQRSPSQLTVWAAVCMFARDSAKRSCPSSVPHRPETIYSRVEDNKIGWGRRTGRGKPGVTGGIQYYYRTAGCRTPLNVDNHACALLGLGVPTIPWFLECGRIYREIASEFKHR